MQKPLNSKLQPPSAGGPPSLPAGWEWVDVLHEEAHIAGCKIATAGLAAQHQGEGTLVTGSAASWTQDPLSIAGFELRERMAIIEALQKPEDHAWRLIDPQRGGTRGEVTGIFMISPEPHIWRAARSNGIAIGSSWQQASQHALCEAVERHMVLASWYGANRPEKVQGFAESAWPLALSALGRHYRLERYFFGCARTSTNKAPIWVSGSFLWPLQADGLVIYGFGAGLSRGEAIQKSLRESIQRLCFLDGSETPDVEPSFEPTPDYHQAFFLHPSRQKLLRDWLSGSFFRGDASEAASLISQRHLFQFVDLTPPHFEQLFVVKAMAPQLLPLCFGRYRPPMASFVLEDERLIHPVV